MFEFSFLVGSQHMTVQFVLAEEDYWLRFVHDI